MSEPRKLSALEKAVIDTALQAEDITLFCHAPPTDGADDPDLAIVCPAPGAVIIAVTDGEDTIMAIRRAAFSEYDDDPEVAKWAGGPIDYDPSKIVEAYQIAVQAALDDGHRLEEVTDLRLYTRFATQKTGS